MSDQQIRAWMLLNRTGAYGNPTSLPISTRAPNKPISLYGLHKGAAELISKDYSSEFGLKTVSFRIFSSNEAGQQKLLLWDLYQKLTSTTKEQEIILFGTGNESRDFIFIDDIMKQVDLVLDNAEFKGEAYNIANEQEVFVKDIVRIMQDYLNTSFPIKFTGEGRPGDPKNWKADISIMLSWGYKQSTEINEGIAKYLGWATANDRH